jgi:predicted N-acetyltransferase YhbS
LLVTIRQETPVDHRTVSALIEEAFRNEEMSDHQEHLLVERLRNSSAFVPELSLVAAVDGQVVGHILLTRIKIRNDREAFDSLALAPVSVLPAYQGGGIGGKLIKHTHQRAEALGYRSVILLGHEHYYPRFGYRRADELGIVLPFDVPKENCLAIELVEGGLDGVYGEVVYPKEFGE